MFSPRNTTRYNPYSFQGAHYSPSPEFSPSPSPLGYSPNPSPLEYTHSPNDSFSSITPSSPAVSATECRLNEPLVDLTNSRDNIRPATSHDETTTMLDEMSSNQSLSETYIAVKKFKSFATD